MRARVAVDLHLHVEAAADVVLSIAPPISWIEDERLDVEADRRSVAPRVHLDAHGGRLHRLALRPGTTRVRYHAEISAPRVPGPLDELDPVRYLRPSRYVPSDALSDTAARFADASARDAVRRVADWVHENLDYAPGSSEPTDSAIDTIRNREGVCRDYAHVTIALLRASGVPARLVSAYAPGLDPMDFHAVTEAFVEGRWEVVDATRLAPRPHLVRIATGRDAADTAFLTTLSGAVEIDQMMVTAVASGALERDDHISRVLLP